MPKTNSKTIRHITQLARQLDNQAALNDGLEEISDDLILSLLDDTDSTATLRAQLEEQDRQAAVQAQMQDTVLSLADYLNAVQIVVTETFAHSVWVQAEIRSLSSKGGHYYFELADKDEQDKVVASCRGNLWRGQAAKVLSKFETTTGMTLERGLNVLLKVTANFHPQYGFSVTIADIDPTYTLGDLAKQYQRMLTKLADEGLLDLNKSLPIPFDIAQVLVIAPENAAGLGDFRADADALHATGACHFYYEHATFQGNHAPAEIRAAILDGLKRLQAQHIVPDLIVIIRGGGAVGDLAYLNDYELAALVAAQRIPVWVGIGHERDRVMLDEVAQISFDTPSKVIAGIRQHLIALMQTTQQAFLQIQQIVNASLLQARRDSEQQFMRIEQLAQRQLANARQEIAHEYTRIKTLSYQQIDKAKNQTATWRDIILLQHPARVLSQGYAIVRKDDFDDPSQTIVRSIAQVQAGDSIQIELQDGQLTAMINNISSNNSR